MLALTVLRQGEKSETYRKQLAVADQLIAVGGAMQTMLDQPLAASWREEIETGLSQVGYHDDEMQAVVKRLFAPDARTRRRQRDLADRSGHAPEEQDAARRKRPTSRRADTGTGEQAALPLNAEEAADAGAPEERCRSAPGSKSTATRRTTARASS